MESTEASNRSAPGAGNGQTIVLERRDRGGCLRKMLLPLLLLSVLINLTLMPGSSGLIPRQLEQKYVAGPIGLSLPRVAVVDVDGLIGDRMASHVLQQIRQAANDETVKAVVLRIDSPGGTVSASDQIWREIQTVLRPKQKPIIASMGSLSASGGYYIAAAADQIVAEPTTLTGSIGVIMEFPQLAKLMEKVGVDFATITSGEWKDTGSMYRPMTPKERQRWNDLVDQTYQRFIRIVAQGRKLPLSEVKEVADGKVLTAQEALTAKLVDKIGYLDDAILLAANQAGLARPQVIRYVRPFDVFESLTDLSGRARGASESARNPMSISSDDLMSLQVPRLWMIAR